MWLDEQALEHADKDGLQAILMRLAYMSLGKCAAGMVFSEMLISTQRSQPLLHFAKWVTWRTIQLCGLAARRPAGERTRGSLERDVCKRWWRSEQYFEYLRSAKLVSIPSPEALQSLSWRLQRSLQLLCCNCPVFEGQAGSALWEIRQGRDSARMDVHI